MPNLQTQYHHNFKQLTRHSTKFRVNEPTPSNVTRQGPDTKTIHPSQFSLQIVHQFVHNNVSQKNC
jgi:hypothetical protein